MKLNYNGPEDHKYDDKKCDRCDYHEPCCEDHKYAHCYPKSPCAYGILFECNNGTMAKIPATPAPGTGFNNWNERSLGCVSIDTSCLKMPTIKFDFNCIIQYRIFAAPTFPSTITFGLFKVCDNNGEEIQCGTWDFRVNFLGAPLEELTTSFCFNYCECAACPGCCTYYVKIIDANNPIVGTVSNILEVMAPSLSVMAKSSC